MTRWKRDTRNLYFLFTLLSFHAQRRQWHPTPVILPGKSHGRRSLVGCSPCGREESDTTEWLHFHFSLSFTGEGNGNPLQCSCLENPRDGEPGGLPSMGSHRAGHDWSDLVAVFMPLLSSALFGISILVITLSWIQETKSLGSDSVKHLILGNSGEEYSGLGVLPVLLPALEYQFSSVTQSCLTLWHPMVCSMPDFPVYHQLLEHAQTHVHWVGDAIQPSHPLSSPSPPTFNLSQHQGLF